MDHYNIFIIPYTLGVRNNFILSVIENNLCIEYRGFVARIVVMDKRNLF